MKNYNITFLRFLAIIIVMFGHSIILYDPSWGSYTSIYNIPFIAHIKSFINVIQMPIWFSIAGYLFYNSIKKDKSFITTFKSKFRKLIIPFLIISLLYLLPIRYLIKYPNYISNTLIYNIYHNIMLGYDNGHLWYLPTLFIIFLIFSFYKSKFNKIIDCIIFIILFILNCLLISFNPYITHIETYAIFFFIGIIINKYSIKQNKNYLLLIPMCLLIIIYIIFKDISYSNIILCIIQSIFTILILTIDFTKLGKNKYIVKISDNSYGMYLLHSPLLYITFAYFNNISPILVIFINFIVFGSITYFITSIISKSKLKFILGQ